MSESQHDVLAAAADAALRAPSVFNTQPWQWHIDGNTLDLYADRDRMLSTVDPAGHLLLLSCGASLHHARVALAASGWAVTVDRFPDSSNVDFVARVRLQAPEPPRAEDLALFAAIERRRTDRRPFGDEPVPPEAIERLTAAAQAQGGRLHCTHMEQMPMLAVAVAAAQAHESQDPAYRNELMRWTNRPSWSKDGVPEGTAVAHVARRVPVRDFVLPPRKGMPVEPGGDRGARYLIVHGPTDEPPDWLRAGEVTSAVLLTAVDMGLAVAPISDVIEVDHPRSLVRRLLADGDLPYLVIRCGVATDTTDLAAVPRRSAADAIRGVEPW